MYIFMLSPVTLELERSITSFSPAFVWVAVSSFVPSELYFAQELLFTVFSSTFVWVSVSSLVLFEISLCRKCIVAAFSLAKM